MHALPEGAVGSLVQPWSTGLSEPRVQLNALATLHSTGDLGRALSVPEASACGHKKAIGTTARFDRVSLEYLSAMITRWFSIVGVSDTVPCSYPWLATPP